MNADISAAWEKINEMVRQTFSILPNLLVALVVFTFFYFVAKWSRTLVRKLITRYQRTRYLGRLLGRLSQGAVILLGLLVSLSIVIPSFHARDLIQVLGLGSVAIGFAFRDIFQNFLAGILLLITQPFHIGDQIVVTGFEGAVEDIQTRATIIKTYDGRRIVIPNSTLFNQSVTVNTAYPIRRSEYDVGIGYGDDVEQAQRLIIEALKNVDSVVAEPAPDTIVQALADSNVSIKARWWTKSDRSSVVTTHGKAIAAIKKTLAESGIDLPFPTQHVLFHDQTEETDGDRSKQREGWPTGNGPIPRPRSIAGAIIAAKDSGRREEVWNRTAEDGDKRSKVTN
jgi:small conductance mechanosensitive channel